MAHKKKENMKDAAKLAPAVSVPTLHKKELKKVEMKHKAGRGK